MTPKKFIGAGFKLAIVGKFEKNVLLSGRQAIVKSERCFNGIKQVETSEPVKLFTLIVKSMNLSKSI